MIPAEGGPKGADWGKDEFKWRFFHQWWFSEGNYSISEVFENSQILPYWRRYIQFWKLQIEFVVQNANIGKYLRWAEIIPKNFSA